MGAGVVTVALTNAATMIPRLASDAPGVVVIEPIEIRQQVMDLIRGVQ